MASCKANEKTSLTDDLERNPLYKLLQGKYKKKYETAKSECHLICIPSINSLQDGIISSDFIDTHILASSPYLKSHYITTDKRQKEVEIEENKIHLKAGFQNKKTIKILGEECGYNKNYQQFRILFVEEPFCSFKKTSNKQRPVETFWEDLHAASSQMTFSQSKKLLYQLAEHKNIIATLEKQLLYFNQNYLVHPDFLLDAASKLKDVVEMSLQELFMLHAGKIETDPSVVTDISNMVESYVLGSVHHKVFPVICNKFAAKDVEFSSRLKELSGLNITADQLGIRELFCCPQPAAVVELASMDSLVTPMEKLMCIQNTIDLLTETLEQIMKENQSIIKLTSNEVAPLTSDELIPILVTIIIQAKLSHLESNLFYIEHFRWSPCSKDKLSFNMVTFQAAAESIKSTNFLQLQPAKVQLKKEISLEELMEVTERLHIQEQAKKADEGAKSNPMPVVDRELQKITKMIEASTRELQEVQQLGTCSETKGHNRSSSLGDFFCGLPDNFRGVSFGKQT